MSGLREALERALGASVVRARDAALRPIIARAEKDLAAAFQKQGRVFLAELAKAKGSFAKESLREASVEGWERYFTKAEIETLAAFNGVIDEATRRALEAGVKVSIAELALDSSFELPAPAAEAFLRGRAAERVTMINGTTREQLRTLLTRAMEDGWSYDKTARTIKAEFDGFAGKRPQEHIRNRAELVAVQEAGEAYEAGNYMVGQELTNMGLTMEKSWLTVGDSRVSPLCSGNQAAGWIPFGQTFPSGHDRPLGHVACRCTMLQQRVKGKAAAKKPAAPTRVEPPRPADGIA